MSFSSNNQNFIKFGFEVPLRGLTADERLAKYQKEIRPEARKRFKEYFDKIKDDPFQREEFFQELIETFGFLEQEYIIYSIYFDSEADFLIERLQPALNKFIDSDHFLASALHRKAPLYGDSYIKGYLREFFIQVLDLTSIEWEEEDGTRNPVTTKLTAWLVSYLFSTNVTTESFVEVILNYTKLWNTYFVDPFNSKKGVILLHKFIEQYKKLDSSLLRLNFHEITSELNHKLAGLLPTIYNSPFTDFDGALVMQTEETEDRSKFSGYLNKKNEFRSLLIKDTILFHDLSSKTWSELIISLCLTKGPGILVYKKEIDFRYSHGNVPNASDIEDIFEKIPELISRQNIDLELLNQVLTKNYIFYADINSLK